jgi:hypothetical protein
MTDRAYDPADTNPFDQFDPDKVGALPANQNKKPDDPFEEFNPFPGQGIKAQADQSSTTGAFARGVERGVVPAVGSLPAIGAGAEVGGFLGTFGGPFAPLTVPVGAVVGGLIGGFTGGYALSKAQDYVLSKAPDSWKEKIGLDDRQEKLDEQEHPYASFLGGLAPYALTMRPGLATTTKLPENATALQRILAHPATARIFGGAAMGGMELGNEAAGGESPDWAKVAVSTGFGVVFNKPTRLGESIIESGASRARAALGLPSPTPEAVAPLPAQQPTAAPQEAQPATEPRPAPPPGVAATLFHAPTVAQASDLNVMGPGVTREVFDGAHERNPSAAMTAQDVARSESLVTQTTPSLPDIHEVARRMDPDLFDKYEELQARRATLQEWITSEGAENAPVAAGHLATLNGELGEMEPQVAAAYRRAAEASGHPTVEPQPVSESWGLFSPPEVRAPTPIDATHTVRSGANSTTDGTVVVDNHIPQFSPKLKDAQGNPANLHDFLAEHETVEAQLMKEGVPYEQAHIRATAAERAKVEAAGVDWNAYTHEIDGYLDHVEHEPNSNPPTQPLHVDPEAAIGHHRSENKPVAETGIIGTAPRSIEAQKAFIADDFARQAVAAGRPREQAELQGKLEAKYWEARATRLGGASGTPEEFYLREGQITSGPSGAAPVPQKPQGFAPIVAAYEKSGMIENAEGYREAARKRRERGGTITVHKTAAAEARARGLTASEANKQEKALRDTAGKKLDEALPDIELKPNDVPADLRAATLDAMIRGGFTDPLEAFEYATAKLEREANYYENLDAMLASEHVAAMEEGRDLHGEIPFEAGGTLGESGAESAAEKGPTQTPAVGKYPHQAGEAVPTEFYQKLRNLIEEREAEGQQQIPGAERITDAERAQRAANQPLRPTAEQKPADEGLFSDEKDQKELFQAARGGIVLNPNARPGLDYIGEQGVQPLVRLTAEQNASTLIHEGGHRWLAELFRDAQHAAAPQWLKDDLGTIMGWLKVKAEDLTIPHDAPLPQKIKATKAHEKFARATEQYLREGIAPSPELAGVFAKFKQWLLGIYQTIRGLGSPINDDVRRVFDRMLSTEPQKIVIAPERTVRPTLADIHRIDAQETPPNEAEPRGDLVNAEAERYIAEPHPEVAHEIQARTAEVQAEREAAAGGTEPTGEARPDAAGSAVLGASGGGAEPIAPGGGVGEGRGAVEEGGGGPVREGNELPGGERGPELGRESTKDAGGNPLASEPGTTFGLGGESFNVGKEGNVRVENITSVPQFAQAIAESAERIGGTGPATMGQMLDLANDLYIDPAKIDEKHLASMFGGIQNLNAKIWALRTAIRDGSKIVFDLSQRYQQSGNDADLAAFAQATARQDMMMSVISSVTTESGRATGMGFRNMEGWEQAQNLGEELKKRTGRELFQLKMMANLISTLDTPGKVAKALRDAQDRSWGGMILEYFVNALISGPSTHVTYTMGNLLLAGVKAGIDTPIAAAIGAARRAGGREGEVVHIGEVGAQFKGAVRGLPGAIQSMIEAARTGQTTLLPGELARPLMPFQGDTALAVAKSMTDDPVAWREVGAQMFGMMRGIRDGFVAGAALLKAGGIEGAPLIGAAYSPLGQIPDLAYRGVRILPGILPGGTMVRLPGRGVAAIHSFYRSLNYSIDKAADAYRTASEEGLTGNDFAARVGDIWQNPAPEKMELYRQGATERTLMGQGGVFVKAISNLVNTSVSLPLLGKTAPLKFIDPFVHIGGNIIKQAVMERTVLGALSSEIRADLSGANGNVAADMAAAKMITGTTMALLFGGLAMEGYASGSGPAEKDKAAMWRLAGNQAHSVRIGDIWYQVNRLGPLGMLMGSAADMYDVAHDASQGDLLTAGAHLLHAFSQNILDESFVRGPADLIRAVEDPGRYGEAYVRQFLSSFVPFSVGMAQMARASDPYSRQARTVMDALKAKIPGLSETLFPRRDIWGEEMPSYEALGHAGLTSIYETRVSRDPVNQAMLNLGISPAQPIRKIRNVDLTDQQYDDYSRIAGRMTKMRLDAIVKSPDWQTWPNHIKHDVISEVIRQSREAAEGVMMGKYPQIPSDATAFKMKKLQD